MVPLSADIPETIVRDHIAHLRALMQADDLGAVIIFHSSNMLAFTGTPHCSNDRLCCGFVTRDGEARVICPAFERPAVRGAEEVAIVHTWEEEQDPYHCLADALRHAGVPAAGRIGVDGRIWLDALHRMQAAFTGPAFQSANELLREVRICKTPAEQEILRAAHRHGERVFLAAGEMLRSGETEIELFLRLQERFRPEELAVTPLVQSGPNAAIPHNTCSDRVIAPGDVVVIDSVVTYDGYQNDLTRTFAIGQPTDRAKEAYRVVREAQEAAISAARAGLPARALDHVARDVIEGAGYGDYFIHRLGHGIGIEGHEPPYLDGGNDEILRPGMVVTIEPGIYVPGEFGIRIEDMVIIRDDGCEVIRGQLPTDVTDAFDR